MREEHYLPGIRIGHDAGQHIAAAAEQAYLEAVLPRCACGRFDTLNGFSMALVLRRVFTNVVDLHEPALLQG